MENPTTMNETVLTIGQKGEWVLINIITLTTGFAWEAFLKEQMSWVVGLIAAAGLAWYNIERALQVRSERRRADKEKPKE